MKSTRNELEEAYRQASLSESRAMEALIAVYQDLDLLVGKFVAEGCAVTVRLIGATRAHGGIILTEAVTEGQEPNISLSYLDEDYQHYRSSDVCTEYGREMRELIGTAITMRSRILGAGSIATSPRVSPDSTEREK